MPASVWFEFGRDLAAAEAERDAKVPAQAARDAWTPGGPSVEEIEAQIRAHRTAGRANHAA